MTTIMARSIEPFIEQAGPFTDAEFVPGDITYNALKSTKVLVIGAGGLGCEILKDLALSGFTDIHVIDMDTIDVSNLNRQFLFRAADVGSSKAEVAARFIMNRVKGVKVTPYFGKIQDKDEDYYMQFGLVVVGLDSIEARRWINATLVGMVDMANPNSLKPLIDGGTEGLRGQARVILPTVTSCYECSLDMHGKQTTYPMCTIANTPRIAAHCIQWASVLEWPRVFGDTPMDTDDPQHIQWLYDVAQARAQEFDISGVTYSLTQGIVKNIIPAVASTNAVIAGACCNEAFKIATACNPFLDNYMMYTGNDSVYSYTFTYEKREDCPVCGNIAKPISVAGSTILHDFIESLRDRPGFHTKSPSLSVAGKSLYLQQPPQLELQTRPNLDKRLDELFESGDEVVVTDVTLPFSLRVAVAFTG